MTTPGQWQDEHGIDLTPEIESEFVDDGIPIAKQAMTAGHSVQILSIEYSNDIQDEKKDKNGKTVPFVNHQRLVMCLDACCEGTPFKLWLSGKRVVGAVDRFFSIERIKKEQNPDYAEDILECSFERDESLYGAPWVITNPVVWNARIPVATLAEQAAKTKKDKAAITDIRSDKEKEIEREIATRGLIDPAFTGSRS